MHDPPPATAQPRRSCLHSSQSPKANNNSSSSSSSSVTLIHREVLPSYSSERYFLLSQVELQAHSTIFLCDYYTGDYYSATNRSSNATQETVLLVDDDDIEGETTKPTVDLPPFVLLYLLWSPDMLATTASEFLNTIILPAVQQTQQLAPGRGEERHEDHNDSITTTTTTTVGKEALAHAHGKDGDDKTSPSNSSKEQTVEVPGEKNSEEQDTHEDPPDASPPKLSIYLVVDRLAPTTTDNNNDDDDTQQQQQQQLMVVEELARRVSTHPTLRVHCQGITVGLSHHQRAAPGLEACSNALQYGAADRRRRRLRSSSRLLGVVTRHPRDLLGLDEEASTDAASGIVQSRMAAEWGGLGTIESFAERAHAEWRRQTGLAMMSSSSSRRSERHQEQRTVHQVALAFLLAYVAMYFYGNFDASNNNMFWFLDPAAWMEAIYRLRAS